MYNAYRRGEETVHIFPKLNELLKINMILKVCSGEGGGRGWGGVGGEGRNGV